MAKKKYKNIFEAIEANDIEAVKSFLPEQLEARGKYSNTPLIYACYFGYTEIVKLLLESGADIKARDDEMWTVLHFVSCCEDTELVEMLLNYGADINATDKAGWTPLHSACNYREFYLSEYMVEHGADPFIVDCKGQTPLDIDYEFVEDGLGNEVPHREILIQLRAEYLNKHTIDESERTAALSSGWEMEM